MFDDVNRIFLNGVEVTLYQLYKVLNTTNKTIELEEISRGDLYFETTDR